MGNLNLMLENIVGKAQFRREEAMAKHTTFRIGGPADYFVVPADTKQLQSVLKVCRDEKVPFYVLGNGSNLLVGDRGYRGVIIQLGENFRTIRMEKITEEEFKVTVGAGVLLSALVNKLAEKGLSGLEFAGGIPGTLGGAVRMNAGAYGGEIKDVLIAATVVTLDGQTCRLTKDDLGLQYRTSVIEEQQYIVMEAEFGLKRGNCEQIRTRIAEYNAKRREKQPLEYPSAGSTFKRPKGYYAGKLIMDAGLSGFRIGDIMVSEKHCGFVINIGEGTAVQVKELMDHVIRVVQERYHVTLEPEIKLIGEF